MTYGSESLRTKGIRYELDVGLNRCHHLCEAAPDPYVGPGPRLYLPISGRDDLVITMGTKIPTGCACVVASELHRKRAHYANHHACTSILAPHCRDAGKSKGRMLG